MIFRKTGVVLALAAICAMPAQAVATECMPREQMVELGVALLPMVAEQATTQCKAFLPENSAMLVKGPTAIEGYQAAAEPVATSAGNTLKSLMGDAVPEALPGDVVLPFVEAIAADKMAGMFDAETCGYANNIWSPLSGLPAYEMSSFLVSLVNVMTDSDDKKEDDGEGETKENDPIDSPIDGLKICPYIEGAEAK